jgi:hypothetical protein
LTMGKRVATTTTMAPISWETMCKVDIQLEPRKHSRRDSCERFRFEGGFTTEARSKPVGHDLESTDLASPHIKT